MKYRGVEAPPAYNRTGSPPNTQFLSLGFSHPSICSAVVCTYFWKSSKWSPVVQTHVVKRSTVVMILKFILYLFQNSPLYQYLQDLGHTDFEVCSSLSPKAEKSAAEASCESPAKSKKASSFSVTQSFVVYWLFKLPLSLSLPKNTLLAPPCSSPALVKTLIFISSVVCICSDKHESLVFWTISWVICIMNWN